MKGTGSMRKFRKKVRRFVRLYWFWVSLGLVLTKVSVEAAYIERGYKAYGGEWLVLPVVLIVGVAFRAKCKIFSRHLQKPILKTEKGRFKGL